MQKLVIFLTTNARIRQCEAKTNPIEITPTWLGEHPAEEYGQTWAKVFKHDIVMLVDLEEAVCKHCDLKIIEKAGWVLHKWVHENGAYLCWSNEHTQAEPKEESNRGASCAEYDACVLDGDCPIFENCYLIGKEPE